MKNPSFLYLISAIAATGGLLFGFDTGVINVALPSLRADFSLTKNDESNIVSAVLFGAMFGPLIAGSLTDYFGRKKVNIAASLIFVLGSVVVATAVSTMSLIIGRALLGIAIGIVAATIPLYLAEMAPKEKRGQLVTYFQLAITLGILLSFLIGYLFEAAPSAWRPMFWAGFIPAAILFLGMLISPESPRWLLSKGKEEEAKKILFKLRGNLDVSEEIKETKEILQAEQQNKSTWVDLFSSKLRVPLLIGIGIFFIQQFSGINAIIYFSTDIFKETFSQKNAVLATVGVGVINTLATILGMGFLDKWGRKTTLKRGLVGTAICLGLVGISYFYKENLPVSLRQLLQVGGIYTYILFFAISLGPLGWLLIAEIYPLKIRGVATSFGSLNHWIFDAGVAYSFPLLRATSLGANGGIFFLYMAVCLLGLLFAKYLVFETKGLSLEEIEKRYDS
jgi:MFS transporter, SP family, galactose:H+ symporter